MKDEQGKVIKCDECGSDIINDPIRSEDYCGKCGLVKDPTHPHGLGFDGLKQYMAHNNLSEYIEDIRLIYTFQGLREARLKVSTL